jgi:hypothetical protein
MFALGEVGLSKTTEIQLVDVTKLARLPHRLQKDVLLLAPCLLFRCFFLQYGLHALLTNKQCVALFFSR